MPPRPALILRERGETFRFYYDRNAPNVLHITHRHGTTPREAIDTFFGGVTGPYDAARRRFATYTATRGLYWARHAHDNSVVVISCFVV
jgi:hypothetical protein